MNIDEAVDIAKRYAEVLGKKKTLLVPVSVLPFTKRHIKIALRTCLIAIRTTNVPDELKNALETDYLALAYFIKDDKAKLMTQDEIDALLRFNELKSELKLNTLLKEMDKQSITNIKKLVNAHEIFGQVIREENTLSQELGELKRQYNLK